MPATLVRGHVLEQDLTEFRKKLGRLDPEAPAEAGFDAVRLYLDGTSVLLFASHPDADPWDVLAVQPELEGWWSKLEEHTTLNEATRPLDLLLRAGGPGVDADLLKLVMRKEGGRELRETIVELGDDVHRALGVRGFEAWAGDGLLVLRVDADDDAWLEEPLDALDGRSLLEVLRSRTDLQPEARGHAKLSAVHTTGERVGVDLEPSPGT